ncbi:MAG: hypothetical protein IT430_16285 [Phycisphaerales bacterium]|nr:hypothetical protein [Phycisphaerales bacterium]
MSKLRDEVELISGELTTPPEEDLRGYVIFTQLKPGQPHLYAGYLDAADDDMALIFAREHYGQDQECVAIWAVPVESVSGTDAAHPASRDVGAVEMYQVFVQPRRGAGHVSAETVQARSPAEAIDQARRIHSDPRKYYSLWVVPQHLIASTGPGDVIWRFSDQSYRLARGYSKDVREKWTRFRDEHSLKEYEKDDLKEAF